MRRLARGQSDDVEQLTLAVRALNDLGATASATRVGVRLAELGGRVPRQRRTATRTHPAGLTEREAEVLQLLADGRHELDHRGRPGHLRRAPRSIT